MFASKPNSALAIALAMLLLPAAGGCAKPPAKRAVPPAKAAVTAEAPAVRPEAVETGQAAEQKRFGPPPPTIAELYRIRTEDLLEVGVWGEEDMTRRLKVGPDGRISYFQATELPVSGRTLGELKVELRSILSKHFKNPEVFVSLVDSAGFFVSVTGVVKSPGLYRINNESRVVDVVAQAGGIPLAAAPTGIANLAVADLSQAFVLRGDKFLDVDFAKLFGGKADPREIAANNVRLEANDRIYVPSAVNLDNKVFVAGAVRFPRVIQFSKEITMLEALLEAGDVPEAAWERRSFIIRGRMNKPEIIAVNTRDLREGRIPDIRLQAGDVVFLPKTPLAKIAEVIGQMDNIFGGINSSAAASNVRYFDR